MTPHTAPSPPTPAPISPDSLRRLHPRAIDDEGRIRSILERVCREKVTLLRAINHLSEHETATVERVTPEGLLLRTRNFEVRARRQLFFRFELDGRPYFFAAPARGQAADGTLRLAPPAVIYQSERRDRMRRAGANGLAGDTRVTLSAECGELGEAEVVDASPGGLGLRLRDRPGLEPGSRLRVRLPGGASEFAQIRNTWEGGAGWRRIGISVSSHRWGRPVEAERRRRILPAGAGPTRPSSDAGVRVLEYTNARGEGIRAIVDGWGPPRGATAVVIPPAWGRTKETLLPLAATLVATFREAREPVTVIRFDGIRKRGESHRDPDCRAPGAENLRFTFSGGVRDIQATLDFLEGSPEFGPRCAVLVTFSVASIEGRRAVARDAGRRLAGWVSAVGATDAQSLTRVISGGIDYFGGVERGLRFGPQELQGLLVDMDRAGPDAVDHGFAFLEDARRDFAAIRVPITWIHGRHDAWMDLERIKDALSFGDSSNRRLIEVPTGHQLRTSREALETFQLIAAEVGRMALGRELRPCLPDPDDLEDRRRAERARLREPRVDVRSFWRDYLVGRNGGVGMELVTSASPYGQLMQAQIEALALAGGERVLDLGSGVGSFPLHLAASREVPAGLEITEADYVREALIRARGRLNGVHNDGLACVRFLECDLDLRGGALWVPVRAGSHDAALASLLLNYLSDPDALLREIHRIVRPGGRLVLSSLRRDADISAICVDTVCDLRAGGGREAFGAEGERGMNRSLQHFISDAARLLDLEERGLFHFWGAEELGSRVRAASFRDVAVRPAFGNPPQAFVVSARRP